jgi:hypothetical protein
LALSWRSGAAELQLERTESLQPPIEWRAVTSDIINDGTTKRLFFDNTFSATNGFYRLHTQ